MSSYTLIWYTSSSSGVHLQLYRLLLHMTASWCDVLILFGTLFLQVFHLHILLAVQDLLCLWIHASCVHDLDGGDHMCHHCLHILPPQLWGLPMVRVERYTIGKGTYRLLTWYYEISCQHVICMDNILLHALNKTHHWISTCILRCGSSKCYLSVGFQQWMNIQCITCISWHS